MAVMTAQPPLPLAPENARPVGAAAAIVEDDEGGRVFVHGNLVYAWDAGDAAGRRFAAVSLMRIKAATQLQVAEAFAVRPATVRRWETRLATPVSPGCSPNARAPNASRNSPPTPLPPSAGCATGGASYRRDRRRHRGVGGQCPQRAHPLAPTPTARSLASQQVPMLTLRTEPQSEVDARRAPRSRVEPDA